MITLDSFTQRAHVSRIRSWRIPSAYLEGLCIRADLCQLTHCWDVPSTSFQNVSAKYLWNIASLFCNCALDSFPISCFIVSFGMC